MDHPSLTTDQLFILIGRHSVNIEAYRVKLEQVIAENTRLANENAYLKERLKSQEDVQVCE